MAISNVMNSVSDAYSSASSMLLGASQDIASGNLDNLASDAVIMTLAQTQASAATALAVMQQEMSQSLLDIRV
jgi:hypothetical protein